MKSKKNTLIIVLIIVDIILIMIGAYAYAKYIARINGMVDATTASWNFKVNNSSTQIETIDLSDTITNNADERMAEGKIAPGAEGAINLVLDASETDVSIGYKIQIYDFINKPINLEFYSDSEFTKPIELIDGAIHVKGYITLEQTQLTHTIYWKWPYEIGSTEQEIEQNDIIDTQYIGKHVTCSINVIGEQARERLVDKVELGDYVNYDASSGIVATYTPDVSLTGGRFVSTFSSTDEMAWRVLSKNTQTGEVELVAVNTTEGNVDFNGLDGYNNAETVLNEIGAVYGHGKGAIGGRSITIEDIEQYSKYDKTTYLNEQGYAYGETKSFTDGNFIGEDGTLVTATATNPVTMMQTYYYCESIVIMDDANKMGIIDNTSWPRWCNMFFAGNKSSYWLASKCVDIIGSTAVKCYFQMFIMMIQGSTQVPTTLGCASKAANSLYISEEGGGRNFPISFSFNVLPVVSLQPNIQTTGKEDSAWQLVTTE